MSDFETEPLSASDVESDFSCGQPQLDDYFKRHALSNDWRGIGKTFVLHAKETDPKDLPHVLGFYSLSMAELATKLPSRLPRALRKGLPKYPLPVALIGRLAVDHRAQRHGLGERLLGDALARVHAAATLLGCFGVIVDAKDREAVAFYETKYGFVPLDPGGSVPQRLFLPMATLADAGSR